MNPYWILFIVFIYVGIMSIGLYIVGDGWQSCTTKENIVYICACVLWPITLLIVVACVVTGAKFAEGDKHND